MTTILIARHGNTFDAGDVVVRVGLKSDLPLSASGKEQAHKLAEYLALNNINLSAIYTSTLIRTIATAQIIAQRINRNLSIQQQAIFNEIDYGVDEGKTEQEVITRIGQDALITWEQDAKPPQGWICDPASIINSWLDFAQNSLILYPRQTILVVTSNGIARFAPYITGDFARFTEDYNIKMATGAISSFTNVGGNWVVDYWNKKL